MPDLLVAALEAPPRQAGRLPRRRGADRVARCAARSAATCRPTPSLGIGKGTTRSRCCRKNRPEVLFTMGANMLDRLPEHAAAPAGLARRPRLRARGRRRSRRWSSTRRRSTSGRPSCASGCPALKTLLSLGPSDVGDDLHRARGDVRARSRSSRRRSTRTTSSALTYTGGTTGKPKGVMSTYRGGATHDARSSWPSGSGPRSRAS